MKPERFSGSPLLERCFRFGIPSLAWGLVFAFFGFAGSVSTRDPVPGQGAAASQPGTEETTTPEPARPVRQARSAIALTADDQIAGEFLRFALNAFLATLLDDDQPPRWSDVALRHVCGPDTHVRIDGKPLSAGSAMPATAFTVHWQMDRCSQLEAFDVSGAVDLLVFHEDTGVSAIVSPQDLTISSADGTGVLRASFPSTLSLLQTSRP